VTSSNENGQFSLKAKETDVLVFSYYGYHRKEVPVNNQTNILVSLSSDILSLEEVIVTGYTSQRKQDITGSVAVVNMDALKSIPSGSAVQAMQGQAAGVNVISSGVPGGTSNVFVRGISS